MTLRARLRHHGLSNRELSALTGISVSTISRYLAGPERADRLEPPLTLLQLLDAWDACPEALAAARGGRDKGETP